MIPKVLHYTFGLKKNSEYFPSEYYISIILTKLFTNIKNINIWYVNEPLGEYWLKIKQICKCNKIDMPLYIIDSFGYEKFISNYKLRNIVLKLNILTKYGGVYLDLDTIIVLNIDELLNTYDLLFMNYSLFAPFLASKSNNSNINFLYELYKDNIYNFDPEKFDANSKVKNLLLELK